MQDQKIIRVKVQHDTDTRIFRLVLEGKPLSEEDYAAHDCKLSEEDGCEVCERWHQQKQQERRVIDTAMLGWQALPYTVRP